LSNIVHQRREEKKRREEGEPPTGVQACAGERSQRSAQSESSLVAGLGWVSGGKALETPSDSGLVGGAPPSALNPARASARGKRKKEEERGGRKPPGRPTANGFYMTDASFEHANSDLQPEAAKLCHGRTKEGEVLRRSARARKS